MEVPPKVCCCLTFGRTPYDINVKIYNWEFFERSYSIMILFYYMDTNQLSVH